MQKIVVTEHSVTYYGKYIGYLDIYGSRYIELSWYKNLNKHHNKGFYHIIKYYDEYKKDYIFSLFYGIRSGQSMESYLDEFLSDVKASTVYDISGEVLYDLCINTIRSKFNIDEAIEYIKIKDKLKWFNTLHTYVNRIKIIESL